jgi:pyrroline-5-carboxylate reductase
MSPDLIDTPILLIGCGRLGSAIVEGWLGQGAFDPRRLMIVAPSPKPVADRAARAGAVVNPGPDAVAAAQIVVLSVKPAKWREATAELAPLLAPGAVVVSVMAGVRADDIGAALGRPVARVMPTTAVATGQGVAALWSGHSGAADAARALFAPLADVVELAEEDRIDVATAVAGSGPAYVHAFTRAMAVAGVEAGLSAQEATRLARGAVRSAAAASLDEDIEALIARIASPGGTTEAGLEAAKAAGLDGAAAAAVAAALKRARELSGR